MMDPDPENERVSSILRAAEEGDAALLGALLAADPRGVHARCPITADTPLHLAAWQGHAVAVEVLLDAGAEVDARGDGGMTPLHYAAKHGDADVAERLARRGADVEARDESGTTVLHYAVAGRIADTLIRLGARPDLHVAMSLGRDAEVRSRLETEPDLVRNDPLPETLLGQLLSLIKWRVEQRRREDGLGPAEVPEPVLSEGLRMLDLLLAQSPPHRGTYEALCLALQVPDPALARRLLEFGVEPAPTHLGARDAWDAARASPLRAEMEELLRAYGVGSPPWPPTRRRMPPQ